ncbi:MAG: hydroxymethylglutaryl-CoA synthase [Candidatus Kariarchaeaceae archaeon]|jgi:3-hydroxy-3-methylglutaryl CoA synthase
MNELNELLVRGSIVNMAAYLGSAQITAEEFVKYKTQVSPGLLGALGLKANSVPLPTEDSATLVMNATRQLLERLSYQETDELSFVEVGTETIKDGALPLSQYVLDQLPHDDVLSSERKHACIAAMNAIWGNVMDNGLVISSDIATYSDDENTAASAEFTGGAGSVAIATGESGELLEILNVRGASAQLTYDFYKPYQIYGTEINANTYPVVFGHYSNIANLERVAKAYVSLKRRVNVSLEDFAGIVLHTPYPGITKYNLGYMLLIDLRDDAEYGKMYQQIRDFTAQAHEHFEFRDFFQISKCEKAIKGLLKEAMQHPKFKKYLKKLAPSLQLISYTGNLYTGSSPLCMMSLLEHGRIPVGGHILWGGYGSGNQAIFMIARTTDKTNEIAASWETEKQLWNRKKLTAEEYQMIKQVSCASYKEIRGRYPLMDVSLIIPSGNLYYTTDCDQYHIKQYANIGPLNHTEQIASKIAGIVPGTA